MAKVGPPRAPETAPSSPASPGSRPPQGQPSPQPTGPSSSADAYAPAPAAGAGHVPHAPHAPTPAAPGTGPARGAGALAPGQVRLVPDSWQENALTSRMSARVLWRPNDGGEPIELVVSLNRRNQFSKARLAELEDGGAAHIEEFEGFISNLMAHCQQQKDWTPNWQRLQMTVSPQGKVHNLTLTTPGQQQARELHDDQSDGWLSRMGSRFTNFLSGNQTLEIDRAQAPTGPSQMELDEQAAERRRKDEIKRGKQRQVD